MGVYGAARNLYFRFYTEGVQVQGRYAAFTGLVAGIEHGDLIVGVTSGATAVVVSTKEDGGVTKMQFSPTNALAFQAGETLRVLQLDVAVDVGRVVDLDGVINQTEGGALQGMSWALKEAVQFDHTRITTQSWADYPILRFSEVPELNIHVLDQPDQPSLGAGESVQGPVAAALGNALFDALGVRVRHLPLSQDHILEALNASS